MMRVSLSILALLGSIKKNTPTVRVWDGLIPLGKVENENTSVSVPTHFEILGLWPLKNRNRYYNINTHNIWVSRYPGIKKHSREVKMKNQGNQLQIAGSSHRFLCWQARALAVDDIITTLPCCLANGLEDVFVFPSKWHVWGNLEGENQ